MKRIILIILSFSLVCGVGFSQDPSPEIQIPSNPGMSIIGLQSAEINKPGNYAGVYANLISPILSNNGTIPTDLAMEFSPYYLQSRDLTWKELEQTNLFRDLRVSIASNRVIDSNSHVFSRLGIGFRTNLITGEINNADKKKITLSQPTHVQTTIQMIKSGIYDITKETDIAELIKHITNKKLKKRVLREIETHTDNIPDLIKALEVIKTEYERLLEPDGSKYDYSLRTGSFLEIAGALAIDFPYNTINFSEINRWGVWINYTYRPKSKNQAIDIGAIARVSNFSFDPAVIFDAGSLFGDLGMSINWKISKTKLIVSAEFIGKAGMSDIKSTEGDNQFTFNSATESKWNVSMGYQITPNTLWSISFSDIAGNSNYLQDNTMQFLMSLSAALAPLKK